MSFFKYVAPAVLASTLVCVATEATHTAEKTHTASPEGSVMNVHAAAPVGSVADMKTHEATPVGSMTDMKVHAVTEMNVHGETTHTTSPAGSIANTTK